MIENTSHKRNKLWSDFLVQLESSQWAHAEVLKALTERMAQGRSGLPAAAMLEQLHTAVADIEQLKADLLAAPPSPQPLQPAVPGKKSKRLRTKQDAKALQGAPLMADAATQSQQQPTADSAEQCNQVPDRRQLIAAAAPQHSRHGGLSRSRPHYHHAEQPCLRAQVENVVPGQMQPVQHAWSEV